MNVDYQQRLEALPGWSWEVLSDQWEQGFSYLKQFTDREEHCRVSLSYKTEDGFKLGVWVSNQRAAKNKNEPVRRQRLEGLPGWSWEVLSDVREKRFSYLKHFSDQQGHCRVSQGYETEDGFKLVVGSFVRKVGGSFRLFKAVFGAGGTRPGPSTV